MSALVYFLLFGGLLFLIMRLGCGSHVMGACQGDRFQTSEELRREAESGDLRWKPPPEVKDPICGKTIETATAKSSVLNGFVYYFCSSDCRATFEHRMAETMSATAPRERLEHSHA